MRLREKIAIFLVAVLVTFVGFNLMVPSSALDILKIGKTQGYMVVVTGTPDGGSSAGQAFEIAG